MKALPSSGRIAVKVKPNAKKTLFTGQDGDVFLIDIAAPADKNKANLELLKFLKRKTGSRARMVSGLTSREKIVELG